MLVLVEAGGLAVGVVEVGGLFGQVVERLLVSWLVEQCEYHGQLTQVQVLFQQVVCWLQSMVWR